MYDVECFEFKSLQTNDIIDVLRFYFDDDRNQTDINRLVEDIQSDGFILIDTLEGKEKLYQSEILMKGINGEYYPVKRENFDKVYEIID